MVDQDNGKGLVSSDQWHWYDKSKLSFWLRYDTWPVELGLCLICDIDPEQSEELDFADLIDMVDIKPEDKPSYVLYGRHCLLSEDPIYKLEPAKHPDRWHFTNAKQYLKDQTGWLELQYRKEDRDDIKPEYINPDYTDICDRIRLRHVARMKRMECRELFMSNPKHSEQERFAPLYFIDWAASKGIDIPWRDWAIHHDLVSEPIIDTVADNGAKNTNTPSDQRRKEGLQAAILVLRQEHAKGKLNDWQAFEKCMEKAVVIKYIRENQTDFPECAKITPITDLNERRSTKSREPTLTRSFPDFAKDPVILAEYGELATKK